ncbi:MAG: hypothetical protein RSE61_07055 [Anaerovoracaceae bacterium]
MEKKLKPVNVIKFAGAYIAFIIGSGFATGQEIMQFYSNFGIWSIGSVLISMFFFSWVGGSVMKLGLENKGEENVSPYCLFCGKYLGTFYEYFVPLFLFGVVVIMISGAGATLNEYYGLNYYAGSLFMVVLVFIAYMIGVNKLVNVLGAIGPAIIIFSILIAVITLIPNMGNLSGVDAKVSAYNLPTSSATWWLSGTLYAAYNTFGAIIFLFALGKGAQSKREAMAGGVLGGVLLMTATFFMNLALLSKIDEIQGLAVPTLHLAKQISPIFGVIFSILLICGIFSTAAPMFWTVCNKITKEGTQKSKIVAVIVIILAFVLGQFPFGKLVGIIYPYTGYLGILLFICLAYNQIKSKFKK